MLVGVCDFPGSYAFSPAGSNDYSVHPAVIGRRVQVTAGLHRVGT